MTEIGFRAIRSSARCAAGECSRLA